MKFYKLNNTWVSWDELHNGYGYTTGPSIAVTYKNASNSSSWGEDAGSGYYVGDIDDMVHGSFWCDSDYGWFELDGLVWNPEIYPSNATPLMMQNGGIASPAVSLESDGVTYYLIKVIIPDTGWITADEASELGWEVYDEPQGTFIVFDTAENKIVSAFTNELAYGEIEGIVLQSPRLVYGVDISVPTIQFWFTDEGRNYDEDKELSSRSILRDENGNRIKSPDSTIYDEVPILAYMHINGDMLESTDGTIEYYGSGSLRTLTSVNGSAVGESVWSVFAERVFTLSFANTQLPGITIIMPSDETGHKGTSITLPTMSGEYESGGKTWKPSAWDIGAFGDSYTLNADTVAHLIFEEVQQYEEITLYTASGNKQADSGKTSSFSGDVRSAYCYQLYKDAACTIPWKEYDYSNEYELGRYIDGVWQRLAIQSISELPATKTGNYDYVTARILLDTGELWYATNYVSAPTVSNISPIVVRIYPKGQQYYAGYFNTSNIYANSGLTYDSAYNIYGSPNTGANNIGLSSNFPDKNIVGFYGSAGNLVSSGYKNLAWSGSSYLRVGYYNTDAGILNVRMMLYTLSVPTYSGWLSPDHSNVTVPSGTPHAFYDDNGNIATGDLLNTYSVIGIFNANGASVGTSASIIDNCVLSVSSLNLKLSFKQTTSSSKTVSRIWYIKTPISQ